MTGEGAMTMAAGRRGFTVVHAGVVSALVWIAALALTLTLASDPWRGGLLVGVLTAIVSGAAGLGLSAMSDGQPLKSAILARVSGSLFRMILVAIGLVATIRGLHAEPLGFVLSYFPLFFLSTVLEQLATASTRTESPSTPGAGGGAQ